MAKRHAAILLPMPAVQRLTRQRPDLAKTPLVITRKIGPRTEVAELNAKAAQQGIRLGMSLPQARAVYAELRVIEECPEDDRAWIEKIARWAQRYGPWVAIYDHQSIIVEVAGSSHLFQNEAALIGDIKRRLAKLGCSGRIAIADTPRASHALALAHREIVICPPQETASCLAPLPLSALSLEASLIGNLRALGLETIGQLIALPRPSLEARFPPLLSERLCQALGEASESPTRLPPITEVVEEMRFETPFSDGQSLLFIIKRLADGLAETLKASALGARRFELRLEHVAGEDALVVVEAAEALDRAKAIRMLVATKLENYSIKQEIEVVRLEALRREPVPQRSASLFDKRRRRSHEAFASLASRLETRLGRQAVLGAHLVDDHRPHRAWQAKALVDSTPESAPVVVAEIRPTVVFDPPRHAQVMSERGRPLVVNGSAVVVCEGPERIRSGWWDEDVLSHDFYRVQLSDGGWWWLGYDLRDRRFAVFGAFG